MHDRHLDLRVGNPDKLGGENEVHLIWKLIFLLAVKERASEIVFQPASNTLKYLAVGQWHDLEPPPPFLAPTLIDIIDQLCRCRRDTAWLPFSRFGAHGRKRDKTEEDEFYLRLGDEVIRVKREREDSQTLRLQVHQTLDLSSTVMRVMDEYFTRRGERQDGSANQPKLPG